ncbi:alpha/beta hydrolase [Bacillus sp. FJAT-47783]|uniref:alpha/beta fold hydrolase n=1 Tax=Bacillus sp. FJAT-47783 TaxID=2922712 RepID=UPI001FADB3C0|nr:alpha/beta hydrolase [Bacillus sp. FJAT-47783]
MLEHKIYKSDSSDYLVLIHGFGGTCSIFYKQIRFFQKYFKIVTIHLPGHGRSPSTLAYDEPLTFDLATKEVVKVLDHLQIDKAHFMSISLGSVLVHCLMKQFPERIKSAVLGGTITRFNKMSHFLIGCGEVMKNITPHIWLYRLFAHIIMPKRNHKRSRDMFVKEAQNMKRSDFLSWFSIVPTVETVYQINAKTMTIPKLYLSGSEDHLFIHSLKQDIKDDPNATYQVLDNCGHVCNVDKADEFNKLANSFLQPLMDKKRIVS